MGNFPNGYKEKREILLCGRYPESLDLMKNPSVYFVKGERFENVNSKR